VFVDKLSLLDLRFEGAEPQAKGRPAYQPATLLKIYISAAGNMKRYSSLHVLAYNLKAAMQNLGIVPLMRALQA